MNLRTPAASVAAFLLAAGVVTGASSPAYADPAEADLEISLVGTTIAEGAPGKFATVEITNQGPGEAADIEIVYDITALDTSKVNLPLVDCPPDGGVAVCVVLDPEVLEAGGHITFPDILEVVPGATGDAGQITISVSHEGSDPDPSNNEVTADVGIGESGPDLLVFAPDVRNEAHVDTDNLEFQILETPVVPGSDALVLVYVDNQGDQAASGIEVTVNLPEDVTFTLPEEECTHGVGDSVTTCGYTTIVLQPAASPGADECDFEGSCGLFLLPGAGVGGRAEPGRTDRGDR